MKKVLNVITYFLCGLFAIILTINVVLIAQSIIDESKVPDVFGFFPLVVLSDSMTPTFDSGDLALYQKKPADTISVGDVVAFYDPDSMGSDTLVTHRVVEITTNDGEMEFKTKGDANNTEDTTLVPSGNIVGLYKGRMAGVGNLVLFMQTTKGMLVCVVLPLCIVMVTSGMGRGKTEEHTSCEKS